MSSQEDAVNVVLSEEDGEPRAQFPVQLGLLQTVASGFSYQVGNQYGSLRFSLDEGTVDIRVEGTGDGNRRFRLQKDEFVSVLSEFPSQ